MGKTFDAVFLSLHRLLCTGLAVVIAAAFFISPAQAATTPTAPQYAVLPMQGPGGPDGSIDVNYNTRTYLEGYAVFNITTCKFLAPETGKIVSAPAHGTVDLTTGSGTVAGSVCHGVAGTFGKAYYTWTDPASHKGDQDSFILNWSNAQYNISFESYWTAVLNSNPPQSNNKTLKVAGKQGGGCDCGSAPGTSSPAPNGQISGGEPFSINIGNVFQEADDYTTSGRNPLRFVRYYNSLPGGNDAPTELGHRWSNNYDSALYVSGDVVTAVRADGREVTFTKESNGNWTSDTDVDLTLTSPGGGGAAGDMWYLTTHNGSLEIYKELSSGKALLQSIASRDWYARTMSYNANNQLAAVTDSFGRKLGFAYDSNGLLTQVTTPGNLVLTYGYDASGANGTTPDRLASVSYNTSPATDRIYSYVNNFDLASITDEDGNVYDSWTYDSQNRATSSQRAGGAGKVTISYDSDTQRTVTGPLGEQTVYTFKTLQGVPKVVQIQRTASGTVPAGTETFTYDDNGYIASKTDWNGNVTTYVNDSHGQPTSITEAAGTPQARTTTIAYTGQTGHLPGKIVAPSLTTYYSYDRYGDLLQRQEDDTSANGSHATRLWSYTYEGKTGHVLTATDPRGDKTTYTYSGDSVATVTNALGQTSQITSYNASGLPLSMTDPNGVVTTFAYDIRNRLLSRTVDGATTTFAYDAAGNLTGITMPDGAQLNYTYDAAHRVTAVSNNVGESINYTLDANGDITQQQVQGTTITETQSAVFDSLGRTLKQIGAYNETTAYSYDANGNNIGTTDALNNTTAQSFDALNRLIKSVDPLNNASAYAYDAQDNLTTVTDPRGLTTTYTYDGFGDVITQTSPDSGETTFAYDQMGNPVGERDARNVVTQRTFDALGRVTAETYPSSPGDNVTYTYDQGQYGIGHLTSFKDASGSTAFTYNARGDIITDTRTIGNDTYKTSYAYDLADRLTSITYPDGRTVDYTRDAFGRISGITLAFGGRGDRDDRDDRDDDHRRAGGQNILSGVSYEPFGPVDGFTYGSGVTATLAYDQDYRLTGITAKGNGGFIQDQTLTYDGVSDITSITALSTGGDKDQAHGHNGYGHSGGDDHGGDGHGWGDDRRTPSLDQTFTYDADMRLLTASGPYGDQSFAYDADGNRTGQSVTQRFGHSGRIRTRNHAYTYDTASNRLLSVSGHGALQYSYLSNGDLSSETGSGIGRSFLYDARNRFSSFINQGMSAVTTGYATNALGERVQKSGGGGDDDGTDYYIYDEQGHLIAEGHDGHISREYIYLGSLPVAELDHHQIYYIHASHLGAPQKLTDRRQRVVWDRIAEPFGQTFAIKGDRDLMNLRFPGQYHDAESGLYYNFYRSYDSATGRYSQFDPIGLLGGINGYAYVNGNPVQWIDPWGLAVLSNNTMGPLRPGDIWQSQVKNYPNAQVYTAPNGTQFLAPKNTDWYQIWLTGRKNGLNLFYVGKYESQGGKFDFQRIGGYHPEYIDASNYGVGVYMNGAGYTLFGTNTIGGTFASLLSSSNPAVLKYWWGLGWSAGQGMRLSCHAPSNLQL